MSLDAQKLVMLIKQAAVEAVDAKDPMSLKTGTVVSVSPLKISINQKIAIPASQLLLTNTVKEHSLYITVDDGSKNTEMVKITVHAKLKTGEKVLLLRCDGGQKFIVLDRLEATND